MLLVPVNIFGGGSAPGSIGGAARKNLLLPNLFEITVMDESDVQGYSFNVINLRCKPGTLHR